MASPMSKPATKAAAGSGADQRHLTAVTEAGT
jgi:hypothetical protein